MSVEVGTILEGKVVSIMPFGAFVDVGCGKEGLLHISKISKARIDSIYRYGDKLYLTVCKEKFDSTMYTYSLTTKKTKKIKDSCMIVDAYKRNAITLDESPTKNTYVVKLNLPFPCPFASLFIGIEAITC